MIRVVLDTNILVSALLNPTGLPAQILLLALNGAIELCMTGGIYAEYEDVLRRPRFQFEEKTIAAVLGAIRDRGLWVKAIAKVRVCTDPDDNKFLDCAVNAFANYLVTGNLKHFPMSFEATEAVTPRAFLQMIQTQANPSNDELILL